MQKLFIRPILHRYSTMNNRLRLFAFLLYFLSIPFWLSAQTTTVRGLVTDAKTGDPLPFVSVFIEGTNIGKNTDFNGQYFIETNNPGTKLKFVLVGYSPVIKDLEVGQSQIVSVKMSIAVKELKTVEIKSTKQRYKNKDNPAVELIDRVIAHKHQNRKDQFNSYQYEKYEKVQFALSNITQKFKDKKYLKKFQFVFDNLDSNQMPGKVILPMYLQEKLSDVYYRKDPSSTKEFVKASHKVDYEDFVNNDGVGSFVGYLYQDVNIYNNTVPILTNPFISPIADNGPLFYRYYIIDTVVVDDKRCYHMAFYPRNKEDFIFQGELYITYDTNYAVKKNELTVNPDINLNWVKELKLTQEYTEVEPGEWLLNKDNISIDFGLGKNGMGVYGQRAVSYKDFVLNQPKLDTFYSGDPVVIVDSTTRNTEKYFDEHRHTELTNSESGIYQMVDSIQKVPAFRHTVNTLELIFAGYKDFGKFEIGPIGTFYSFNPIEGSRIRLGGRTSKNLSERIQFNGYGVYGLKDKKWKYFTGVRLALGQKSFIDFPQRNLLVSYEHETKIPGQELQFVQEDNFLLSFKRGPNDKLIYLKRFNIEYLKENNSHFSYAIGIQNLIQTPAGSLHFKTENYNDTIRTGERELEKTTFNLTLRYAPHEAFYQGKTYRTAMPNKYPIFQLRYEGSLKNVFKSDYTFHTVTFNLFKRLYIPPIGYSNIEIEVGKTFGTVPYPLLEIHRANQTYSYQLSSYNLMNFLEFVSDEYASIFYTHFFNGFFFNKIPLFKKLKWREVVSAKVLYGRITDANNPTLHPDLYRLPINQDGSTITYTLQSKPYIEASVGISNIFKVLRVDLIKRLSYLDHNSVSQFGIRARLKLDF